MQPDSNLDTQDVPIRLLIVADDPLARAGLVTMFEDREEIDLVGQMTGGEGMVEELDLYRPDVLVWDWGWDADEAPVEIADLDVPTLALLPHADLAADAWAAGAAGLLMRDSGGARLVSAVQAMARQLHVFDEQTSEFLKKSDLLDREAPPVEALTPREQEVLQLLAEGLSNRAIAQELEISEHTVKFHVNAIMSKLDAQSRTEAVVRATRLGLILL